VQKQYFIIFCVSLIIAFRLNSECFPQGSAALISANREYTRSIRTQANSRLSVVRASTSRNTRFGTFILDQIVCKCANESLSIYAIL